MRDRVDAQEAKLRRLRALRGQVGYIFIYFFIFILYIYFLFLFYFIYIYFFFEGLYF